MAESRLPPTPRRFFHVGRILAAHGLSGEVHVQVLSSDLNRFDDLGQCLLTDADETKRQPVDIEGARRVGRKMVLKLSCAHDRSQAEALRGHFLSVPRSQALALEPGEYFISDLIGCDVIDAKLGLLGQVADVLEHGAQDVYVIRLAGENDLLLPAAQPLIQTIDLERRTLSVCLPDGLHDLYRGG